MKKCVHRNHKWMLKKASAHKQRRKYKSALYQQELATMARSVK